MPIKPENKDKYSPYWDRIRKAVLKRAGDKCEECGVVDRSIGYRDKEGKFIVSEGMQAEAEFFDGIKHIQIVLTVAHLDHNPENNDWDNLKALCQKCHFKHDLRDNILKARETRRKKEAEAGQEFLFEGEGYADKQKQFNDR